MGFSNDDDPYGAMFAAADAEQREKAAASDKEWAARGVVKVAPEPEEPEEPAEPEIKVNWPSYIREDVRELWKEAGILPEENALVGEDFGWELESEAPAHTEAGQKRREDEKGPVMEAMVDSLKFFGAKSTKSREIRKELRGLSREAGRQLGTLLKAIHLFEEDEAGFSHMRAARLRTNLITREGIPLILEGLHPVYRTRGVQVGMLKELDLAENSLGGVGVARLCDGLIRLRYIGLERLDLSGNHSHIDGARALARLISSEAGCTINMLQTRRNNHFDAGIKCFGKVSFGRLEFLDIRENFFTARGAAELANGFRDNETLTALDFRGTVLALEGLWALGNALQRRKKRFREIQLRLGDKFSRAPIKDKWQALAERDGWTEEEIKYAHDAPSNPQREGETLEAWHERRDAQMGLDHRVLGDDPGPRRREDLGEVGSKFKHAPYEYDVFFFGEPVKAKSLFQKCFGHHIIGSLDITCCPTCYAIPMLWKEYGTTACSVM